MDLQDTTAVVALVGVVGVGVTLLAVGMLSFRLRKIRRAQVAVLGESEKEDLVAHAAELQHQFELLSQLVEETGVATELRVAGIERRQDLSLSQHALVRYDAYGEQSGHQSASIALLNSSRTGMVLSSIVHRDQARLYAKEVAGETADPPLSPEELEAVRLARNYDSGGE